MNVRYNRDPETGLPHIYNHNVTESEVEDILARPAENRPGRGTSRILLGQTGAGRYLQVICVPDPEPGGFFVVTAFELRGKALKGFRRRRRRRRK